MPPVKALACTSLFVALLAPPVFAQDTFSNPASNSSGSGAPSTINPAGPQANPNGRQHKHRHQHARSGDQNAQQAQGGGNNNGQGQQRQNWRQPQGGAQGSQSAPSTAPGNN